MTGTPRLGLAVLALAAAGAAGYGVYLSHNAAPPPAPTPRRTISSAINSPQPIPNHDAALLAQAVPASQQPKTLLELHAAFREAQRCMEERTIIRAKSYNPNGASPPPHILGCDDMKGAYRKVYEATTAAAKAGDVDAQMCYLGQGYGDRESGFRLSDSEIAEYQSVAPKYVQAAFERGDWRVVQLLGFQIIDWVGLFMNLEQWKDPLRQYKAYRLFLLGAGEADPQDQNPWLSVLRMPEAHDYSSLSAQQIQEGNTWAQATYDRYFISQPKLLKEPQVCTAEDQAP